MRRLWEDHVTWTRVAIISLTSGSADTSASVGRLLENQADIGRAHDEIHLQALHMADMLSAGIVKQFPKRFL